MIFDSHAHYDDEAFDADQEEVLAGLKEQGVGTVVNVGASIASTRQRWHWPRRIPSCMRRWVCIRTRRRSLRTRI